MPREAEVHDGAERGTMATWTGEGFIRVHEGSNVTFFGEYLCFILLLIKPKVMVKESGPRFLSGSSGASYLLPRKNFIPTEFPFSDK